jgi:hypothetical protein
VNLDEVGESELLAWFTALGVIGKVPGSLLTYQEMSHHGHGVVQFLPDRPERKEWLGRDVPLYGGSSATGKVLYRVQVSPPRRPRPCWGRTASTSSTTWARTHCSLFPRGSCPRSSNAARHPR